MVGERKKYQSLTPRLKTEHDTGDDKELGKHLDSRQQQLEAF